MNYLKNIVKKYSFLFILLLFTACNAENDVATAVSEPAATEETTNTATTIPPTETPTSPTETLIPPTEEPPTNTPPPSTHTPEPPTATPDITSSIETFIDEFGRIDLQYPADWVANFNEQSNEAMSFILTSSEEVLDQLEAANYSQPLGVFVGELQWFTEADTDNPTLILQEWVDGSGLALTPASDVTIWTENNVQYATRDFIDFNADGDTLLLTTAVIINGSRFGMFVFGTTAVGEAEYMDTVTTVFNSIQLYDLDPTTAAEIPAPDPNIIPTPALLFDGEMAITYREDNQNYLAILDMETGELSPAVAERAEQPAWRHSHNDLSYTECNTMRDVCVITLTSSGDSLLQLADARIQHSDWSLDGRFIAYSAEIDGNMDIYSYDFDTDPPTLAQLTDDEGTDADPSWSNDNQFIAFASNRDGDYDIYIMIADGSYPINITQNTHLDYAPVWSPTSAQIAYLSDRNGRTGVFIYDIPTETTIQVTDNPYANYSPTWSPDGRFIAYLTEEDANTVYLNVSPANDSGAVYAYNQLPPGSYRDIAWRPSAVEINAEIIIDFEDPASVLQAVFASAQTGDFTLLASLCDPEGENDGDTASICAVTAGHEDAPIFIEWFSTGQITGELIINGDQAELDFTFGPEGDQEETMIFIQKNGLWYLYSF